jgi:hypothetical protein
MNKKDRAILYGLAIGDGHISYRTRLKDGKYRYEQSELIIGHGHNQLDYIEYKADLIHSIFGGNRPKVSIVFHTVNEKRYEGRRIAKTNPYFRLMHKELYKEDNKKKITPRILEFLDEQSIALWFMDDGSISSNKNNKGEITSLNLRICTQFSEEEGQIVCSWFKEKYDIEMKYYRAKNKYDIGANTQDTVKLINLIFDYIHNSMFYKIRPLAKLIICKSARHPHFSVGDDIVQSVKNKINSVQEVNS